MIFPGKRITVTRREFVDVWFETDFGGDLETLPGTLLSKGKIYSTSIIIFADLKKISGRCGSRIRTLFEKSSRKRAVFLESVSGVLVR